MIIGNDTLLSILEGRLEKNVLPKMILFTGPVGTGKSTICKWLADKINPEDITTFNMAETHKIQQYIDIIFKYKQDKAVFILEELEYLGEKQGMLLEYTNNMTEDIYLIACTSDARKINKGLLSRFTQFETKLLNFPETEELIATITEGSSDSFINKMIFRYTRGTPRDIKKIVNMELSDEEYRKFLKYIESNVFLDLIKSTSSLGSFLSFLRNTTIDKNFILNFKDYILEAASYLCEVVDVSLNRNEKIQTKQALDGVDVQELLKAVSQIKDGDIYSFMPFFKCFNKTTTPSKELDESEQNTYRMIEEERYVDESLSDEDVLGELGILT